jgi:hypothetical protein
MRHPAAALAVSGMLVLTLYAQEGIQRGTIKKVDPGKGTLLVHSGGKNVELTVTADTKMMDAANQEITQRLRDERFKTGALVMFKTTDQDGKIVLFGIKLIGKEGAPGGEPQDIQRGKVKTIDLEKKVLVLTVGGADREFAITETTQVLDARDKGFPERFEVIKPGAAVMFKAIKSDGKEVLIGLKLGGPSVPPVQPKVDTSRLKALPDLGPGEYQGFQGGFYPGGKNERPPKHEAAGLRLAMEIRPLDATGKPDPNGKIVLLSIGMSNTQQASMGFKRALKDAGDINPHFLFVSGAEGGMTARAIQDPDDNKTGTRYWNTVDQRLQQAGVTRDQVQVVWIKEADARPNEGFPDYAKTLQAELKKIVQLLPKRFPNCKMVYLSSRTYGGYASTPLNPDPYAYESGFSVKWLIEEQLKGDPALNYDPRQGQVRAPWLSWGPYLWANGTTKSADGYWYDEKDFASDGTHLSNAGVEKVGQRMLQFFRTDSTTRSWFVRAEAGKLPRLQR